MVENILEGCLAFLLTLPQGKLLSWVVLQTMLSAFRNFSNFVLWRPLVGISATQSLPKVTFLLCSDSELISAWSLQGWLDFFAKQIEDRLSQKILILCRYSASVLDSPTVGYLLLHHDMASDPRVKYPVVDRHVPLSSALSVSQYPITWQSLSPYT